VIGAVVSRGGRPDLVGDALERVRAPTLLIVGGADYAVIELNKEAAARMTARRRWRLLRPFLAILRLPATRGGAGSTGWRSLRCQGRGTVAQGRLVISTPKSPSYYRASNGSGLAPSGR
jgi:hypothetical protein